jgi:hypothetical protein
LGHHWVVAEELLGYESRPERLVQEERASGRASSYTQSMKDGEVPTAYAPAFETHLTRSRIFMDKEQGRSFISEASKALCESLLLAKHGEPEFTQFPLSKSSGVLNRFHTRNEYRIFRDITPLLVPSAELLFFCGDGSLDLTLLLE